MQAYSGKHRSLPAIALLSSIVFVVFLSSPHAFAQTGKLYRVGVIHPGGAVSATVNGLRQGLRELGLEEGKQVHLIIKDVKGEEFRRVSLKGTGRAGVLTHASILTVTSNPNRTSPVKRGKWVLENLLGTPPPPPPPDVPELSEEREVALPGSLRKRMELHRTNPTCAVCHQRMDPIGFGLENFDGVGACGRTTANSPSTPRARPRSSTRPGRTNAAATRCSRHGEANSSSCGVATRPVDRSTAGGRRIRRRSRR